MDTSVHERLVASAVTLLRTHGADGFGMTALLEHSSVARRSMYQHFPDGKAQLLREATTLAGKSLCATVAELLADGVVDGLTVWIEHWKAVLVESDYTVGCPLAAASASSIEYPAAAAEAGRAFDRAATLITDALLRDGHPPERAHAGGVTIVSGLEGAILVARATRSVAPLDAFIAQTRAVWDTHDVGGPGHPDLP